MTTKTKKGLIITAYIICVIAITFTILLIFSQKEKKLNVTGDPIKDTKIVTELLINSPEKVKEYLGFFETEYTDKAKMEKFKEELEKEIINMNFKIFKDPKKDAQFFISVAFLEVKNQEVCQNRAMEFLNMVMTSEVYTESPEMMNELRNQLDTLLNNEGMSLADLGF